LAVNLVEKVLFDGSVTERNIVNELHLTFADEASKSSFFSHTKQHISLEDDVDVDQAQRLFRMALAIFFESELSVLYMRIV